MLSLNVCFFAHYGAQLYREGTKLAKGHLYALMWHLALHIRAHVIVTSEPGNCPRESFLPLMGHSCKEKTQKGHLHDLNGVFSPSH